MIDDLYTLEARDGIRCSWNIWPNSKVSVTQDLIPISLIYSPLKTHSSRPLVEYEPVLCRKCKSILNPLCQIEFSSKSWTCPICLTNNFFPTHYKSHISQTTLPTELAPQSTTIEYILATKQIFPPVFIFLIDTCCSLEELSYQKSSLQQILNLLPSESIIGLISYGKNAYIYNLSNTNSYKSYVFRGDKIYDLQMIKDQLGLLGNDYRKILDGVRNFLMPIGECEFMADCIVKNLEKDQWPVLTGFRPLRCIGTALFLAITLLEIAYSKCGARVVVMAGGAASHGPGKIVGEQLVDVIRTQFDLKNGNNQYYKDAKGYYDNLAMKACYNGHAIDVFCCAIDQIGILEMRSLCEKTGGFLVLTDTFKSDVFRMSFRKMFDRDETGALLMGFNANIVLMTSQDVKISGAIGPGVPLKSCYDNVSDIEVGMSKTNMWQVGHIDQHTTIGYYLDLNNTEPENTRPWAFIQFQTKYQHPSGHIRLLITTTKFPYTSTANVSKILSGFDQETATVIMARLATHKSQSENTIDILRWLDRSLIRLVKKFCDYQQGLPNTFRLCKELSLYPQFMFHLRRSQFLQSFNISPDEKTYYHILLNRENVTNSLLMIQPALLQYSFDCPQALPVVLDLSSLKKEVILLLDTFFNVLIWHGETITKWSKLGYHNQEGYDHFKSLLEMPREDAQIILNDRFPVPKLQETEVGKGPERFLKAKIIPTNIPKNDTITESQSYLSEDVSFKAFMDSLIQYTVNK
ncbi:hypothetical protein SteCoe_13137 [Stentor coeruleus]|uniref:Protein transport protein SEC23 n=1 Tax=Stentor coeruleus TaxID=5963 RepID=A0A1R2C925_9CILI|nr:hypothetical protein SteCoe_13137 [Stentor coeruleus]